MYRSCIFCSADLGSNDSIEQFPVGRSLAFDAEKGRLWAVCRRCGRWNLAPIEERWESIEGAERLFRDSRLRVQSENIGLTRLRDGTRLVRVGPALAGELALFRYGELLLRRRRRFLAYTGIGLVTGAAVVVAGTAAAGFGVAYMMFEGLNGVRNRIARRFPVARLSGAETSDGAPAVIHRANVNGSVLQWTADGTLCLRIPDVRKVQVRVRPYVFDIQKRGVVLHGETARRVLSRAMLAVNAAGARPESLQAAVNALARAESPGEYVMRRAREEVVLTTPWRASEQNLALEMALHEDTERRAMEGELAGLEEMWRQAEEVAAIADRLPDVPPSEPPRV